MNIIKGLDRIILMLAIIALVPGFIFGYTVTYNKLTIISPKYEEWEKKYSERKKYVDQKLEKKQDKSVASFLSSHRDPVLKDIEANKPNSKYQYPLIWQCAIAGFFGAVITFPVVLFGLRGMTRGIRRLFLWIVEGFKDEKKE